MGRDTTGLARRLGRRLEEFEAGGRLCVAYSGGADSSALLHACTRLPASGRRVRALHVHHGLQADAERWAEHCRGVCGDLGVALRVLRVDAAARRGESPEQGARRARYAVLAASLEEGETLLSAHHLDDQAETVLLQLFRGAGPAGLAAMPWVARLGRGRLLRPWLDVPHAALVAYCREAGLGWVEDPVNHALDADRSFLRQSVMPVLRGRFPGVARTLARAARHQGVTARLCADLADLDLGGMGARAGDSALPVEGLRALAPQRACNVLRAWLRGRGIAVPSSAQLAEVLRVMLGARADARPLVAWRGGEVRRHAGLIHAMRPLAPAPRGFAPWAELSRPLDLPAGTLSARRAIGAGLAARCVPADGLRVGWRTGGERLRPAGSALRRPLKKLLQERGLAPWERERLPLLFAGEELVAVAGLWVSHGCAAQEGQPGWIVEWAVRPG